MSIKVLSCQGVVGSPVVKLGFWSFEDLKICHPSSISSALCSPVSCGMFLSYQRSLWHLHVFLWVQFSHGVKTDNHTVFVIPFKDISLLLKDFFCNYFWTTAFFFTVAHMAFASPWEDVGDLLCFPIRHRMCVSKEGEYMQSCPGHSRSQQMFFVTFFALLCHCAAYLLKVTFLNLCRHFA